MNGLCCNLGIENQVAQHQWVRCQETVPFTLNKSTFINDSSADKSFDVWNHIGDTQNGDNIRVRRIQLGGQDLMVDEADDVIVIGPKTTGVSLVVPPGESRTVSHVKFELEADHKPRFSKTTYMLPADAGPDALSGVNSADSAVVTVTYDMRQSAR